MARRGDVQISAERLKARRESRFLSQAELAQAAGMGLSNVQRLERGQISAIMRTGIPKLASALRMTEQEFMDQIAITPISGTGSLAPAPIGNTHAKALDDDDAAKDKARRALSILASMNRDELLKVLKRASDLAKELPAAASSSDAANAARKRRDERKGK